MDKKLYFIAGRSFVQVNKQSGSWSMHITETERTFLSLAADPHRLGRFYGGTFNHGLWLSDDDGKSWNQLDMGKFSKRIPSVVVSETEVMNGFGVVWVGTEPSELLRSEDGGKTWTSSPGLLDIPSRSTWSFPPRPYTHHVRVIQPDIHEESRMFLGIELGGVMKSSDKGNTWEDRKENSQFDCHKLTMNKLAKGRIYEAAGGGYAESLDGGATWKTINDGLDQYTYLVDVATDSGNPNIIIASAAKSPRTAYRTKTAETVIVRKENDDPWEIVSNGLPAKEGATVFALTADEVTPSVFYAVNNQGLFQSSDTGKTWERLIEEWPEQLKKKRVKSIVSVD